LCGVVHVEWFHPHSNDLGSVIHVELGRFHLHSGFRPSNCANDLRGIIHVESGYWWPSNVCIVPILDFHCWLPWQNYLGRVVSTEANLLLLGSNGRRQSIIAEIKDLGAVIVIKRVDDIEVGAANLPWLLAAILGCKLNPPVLDDENVVLLC
jgi:hypothetical protein